MITPKDTNRPRRRVLVIDDDPKIAGSMSLLLRAEGYDVETLTDSAQSLERIGGFAPDVVLLDMLMPGMNGFEVCKAIREGQAIGDLPVIFVSAVEDPIDRLAALQMASDYVVKPFEPRELIARVYKAIHVKDLQDELKAKNAELREMILVDEESGLFGRNYLIERLGEEIARARRYSYTIAGMLVEINETKELTAALPRERWIALIQEFAWTFRDGLRMADLLCRHGEGAFFAMMPSTDSAGARIVADGVVDALQKRTFTPEGKVRVTVSIGLASLAPNELIDRHAFLRRAEDALHTARAKRENPIFEG